MFRDPILADRMASDRGMADVPFGKQKKRVNSNTQLVSYISFPLSGLNDNYVIKQYDFMFYSFHKQV